MEGSQGDVRVDSCYHQLGGKRKNLKQASFPENDVQNPGFWASRLCSLI